MKITKNRKQIVKFIEKEKDKLYQYSYNAFTHSPTIRTVDNVIQEILTDVIEALKKGEL